VKHALPWAPRLFSPAPKEFKTVAEAIADCALIVGTTAVGRRDPQHPVKRPEQGAPLIRKRLANSRVALLFGSEKRGLSNEDLSHCHWLLRIPTREEHHSMNLGQAVAVCLYELARDPHAAPPPGKRTAATAAELERITSALLDALLASGYVKSLSTASQKRRSAAPTDEKIRRLVRRSTSPLPTPISSSASSAKSSGNPAPPTTCAAASAKTPRL